MSDSRILHELAGAASLCWEPKPTGVFNTEQAIKFVEEALVELRADYVSRAALAQRADELVAWIPVAERMPKPGVKVLVLYANSYGRTRRTCAHYSPKHTVDASTWDEGEPDETEDGTFEPEGWWEEPVEIERVQFIADEVTHWMPLPAFPGAAAPAAPDPQRADEPVAWIHDGYVSTNKSKVMYDEERNRRCGFKAKPVIALYPAAPAYVPLSEDLVQETYLRTGGYFAFARAVEALVVARMKGTT